MLLINSRVISKLYLIQNFSTHNLFCQPVLTKITISFIEKNTKAPTALNILVLMNLSSRPWKETNSKVFSQTIHTHSYSEALRGPFQLMTYSPPLNAHSIERVTIANSAILLLVQNTFLLSSNRNANRGMELWYCRSGGYYGLSFCIHPLVMECRWYE